MRKKLSTFREKLIALLCFTLIAIQLNGQFTDVPQLIITEYRCDNIRHSYIEFTNVGDDPIDLDEFSLHAIDPWGISLQTMGGDSMTISQTAYGTDHKFYFKQWMPNTTVNPIGVRLNT